MSKSAPQAPPPPNQTGSNIDTAVAQKALNNTNQYICRQSLVSERLSRSNTPLSRLTRRGKL
jgi:hypothetical protein